jgi:hypothetical protein
VGHSGRGESDGNIEADAACPDDEYLSSYEIAVDSGTPAGHRPSLTGCRACRRPEFFIPADLEAVADNTDVLAVSGRHLEASATIPVACGP